MDKAINGKISEMNARVTGGGFHSACEGMPLAGAFYHLADFSREKQDLPSIKAYLKKRLAAHYHEQYDLASEDRERDQYYLIACGVKTVGPKISGLQANRLEALEAKRIVYLNYKSQEAPAPQQFEPALALMPVSSVERSSLETGIAQLQARIRFLEAQLQADNPYIRLYKFGGLSLIVAVVSLLSWAVMGVGVPFNPIFALMVVPVAIGVMVMAFLVRGDRKRTPDQEI